MTDKTSAGSSESGDSDGKDNKSEPNKEDFVPRTQLVAALNNQSQKHEREMAELKSRLEKVEKPSESEKDYTRAELKKLVDDGHITEDQANLKWDEQIERKVLAKAGKVATDAVNSSTINTNVQKDIDRYVKLEPDLKVEGTEIREKIKSEFQNLVQLGDNPSALTTELKALRIVLGPVESFELARSGRNGHESHEETGGGSGSRGSKGGKSFKDSLSERKRTYYQKQIDSGIYSGWDEVKEELKYSSKRVAA